RVRGDGESQGTRRASRGLETRPSQRSHPSAHLRRPRVRDPAGRRRCHRDRLRLAGYWPTRHRVDGIPRLPGDPGDPVALRRAVHRNEPGRRSPLRLGRSPHPSRGGGRTRAVKIGLGTSESASPSVSGVDVAMSLRTGLALEAEPSPAPGALARLRRRKILVLPFSILLVFVAVGVFAPYLAPLSPTETDLGLKLMPPAWVEGGALHRVLGTDQLGRDILSRIVHGARLALTTSLAAIVLSGFLGTILGMLAGYYGDWVDAVIMRVADMTLAIHIYILAIVLAVVWGPGLRNVLLVVVFLL